MLRAGAFGALHGGHAGWAAVGVTVPVPDAATLKVALGKLSDLGERVTLLCPAALAWQAPADLAAATAAGHEVAGFGRVREVALLQAVTGQRLHAWASDDWTGRDLRTLAAWDIHPLPEPLPTPDTGGTLRVSVDELGAALPRLRRNGFMPQPVRTLPGLRQAVGADLAQHFYQRLVEDPFSAQPGLINLTEQAGGTLRIMPLDHAPAPLPLPRQTPTAELHLYSPRVVGLNSRNTLMAYRACLRGLSDAARALDTRPELADAQAVFAVSLFSELLEGAGFTLLDLPKWQGRWYGLGFRLLRLGYGKAQAPSRAVPQMAWMPRDAFLARYGSASGVSRRGS